MLRRLPKWFSVAPLLIVPRVICCPTVIYAVCCGMVYSGRSHSNCISLLLRCTFAPVHVESQSLPGKGWEWMAKSPIVVVCTFVVARTAGSEGGGKVCIAGLSLIHTPDSTSLYILWLFPPSFYRRARGTSSCSRPPPRRWLATPTARGEARRGEAA